MSEDDCQTCAGLSGESASRSLWRGRGSLVSVWEDPEDYNKGHLPDYIGCTDCHTMRPVEGGKIAD